MLIVDNQLTLDRGLKVTMTSYVRGAMHVTVHDQEVLFTFRLLDDSPTGIRLEQFQPEVADPAMLLRLSTAVQAVLECVDWQYVVALYPLAWRPAFERLSFHHLSERIRWEMILEPGRVQPLTFPDAIDLKPLTSSAECLGTLLAAAENDPSIPLARCTALCQEILEGTFGPLIEKGSAEIWIQDELLGVCIFTSYFEEALLGHIFLAHRMQGRGLASVLLHYCLKGLILAGYTKAVASTDATNSASRRMHARAGFTQVEPSFSCSLIRRANWKNGEVR